MQQEFKIGSFTAKELIEKFGSPLYVYDENTIRTRYRELKESIETIENKKILYACKANSNVEIIKVLKEEGAGMDVVAPGEVYTCLKAGVSNEEILFTGNNMTNEELDYAVKEGVILNIGDLSTLERYGEKYPNTSVCVRINPDVGGGHHHHVITGGVESKFGIYFTDVPEILKISEKYNVIIKGIHQHIGSNILDENTFLSAVDVLLKSAKELPDLDFIDFGGGLGIPYEPGEKRLNLIELNKKVAANFKNFCQEYGKEVEFWIEPGRFLVGESGYLLTTVNTVKSNPSYKYAGTDSGFNHLVRPTMYGSYHEIVNTSNLNGDHEKVTICGNICESGDIFARDRVLPIINEGDILAILNAGAYGYTMASNYNTRPLPAEVLVNGDQVRLIRRRETFEELLRNQIFGS
ncbi:MAG: diaminopimelate decarboxylase [Candidatus Sericytochromatia bacterium]|nr:diaminopimelate decarboxylase [Candidatus Sericytochromatia bacterium]